MDTYKEGSMGIAMGMLEDSDRAVTLKYLRFPSLTSSSTLEK